MQRHYIYTLCPLEQKWVSQREKAKESQKTSAYRCSHIVVPFSFIFFRQMAWVNQPLGRLLHHQRPFSWLKTTLAFGLYWPIAAGLLLYSNFFNGRMFSQMFVLHYYIMFLELNKKEWSRCGKSPDANLQLVRTPKKLNRTKKMDLSSPWRAITFFWGWEKMSDFS